VLNVFRLFAKLGPVQVEATSSAEMPLVQIVSEGVRSVPDVGVLATRAQEDARVDILIWHYRDDDVPGPAAEVHLVLSGIAPGRGLQARVWRVDRQSGDAFTEWRALGAPASPTPQQINRLVVAARMVARTIPLGGRLADGSVTLDTSLPVQGVELIEVR
jgi:xylan 1,4-beta-xylosidase